MGVKHLYSHVTAIKTSRGCFHHYWAPLQTLNVEEQKQVARAALPLSPGATLKWLSVTDTCTPATMDSAGVLRIWCASFGGSWLPAMDKTSCEQEETVWPLGIADGELRYIPCELGAAPEVRSLCQLLDARHAAALLPCEVTLPRFSNRLHCVHVLYGYECLDIAC